MMRIPIAREAARNPTIPCARRSPLLPRGSETKLIEPSSQPQRSRSQDIGQNGDADPDALDWVGCGDASGHAGWAHVGLGTAERVEIRVQRPDGERGASCRVFANRFVVIDRTKPQATYWYPGR